MLDNIDVLKLLKTLTEVSDAFKVLNEYTQERIIEYLDTQIAIEEDINYEGEQNMEVIKLGSTIKFKSAIIPEHAVMYGDEIIYRGSESQCHRYVFYMSGSSDALIKDHPSYKKDEMEQYGSICIVKGI